MPETRTLDWYIDAARERLGGISDNELSRRMNFKGRPITLWRTKRSLPNDESMMQLADHAGVDRTLALIDLNVWRSEGEVKTCYLDMARQLAKVAAIALIFLVLSHTAEARTIEAQSNLNNAYSVYYVFRRRIARMMSRLNHLATKLHDVFSSLEVRALASSEARFAHAINFSTYTA